MLAIAGLILVKEAGVPISVPGDLVVIGAGVAANRGDLDSLAALVAIVLAASPAASSSTACSGRWHDRCSCECSIGSVRERVDRQTGRLRRGGASRRARPVHARRSDRGDRGERARRALPAVPFVAGLAVGNALFIGAHFGLGC